MLAKSVGGGGVPGGSNTQLQFNDAGVFGGASGILYDKTTGKVRFVNGINDNAGTPLLSIDTGARKLYASDGVTLGLDYSTANRISGAGAGTPGANSNFFGNQAGYGTTTASANFFGNMAGKGATGALNSNFFGTGTGENAIHAMDSNFFGNSAGADAIYAYGSNFFTESAGYNALGAYRSNFFGYGAGDSAANANHSNFFNRSAGESAIYASHSNFFGMYAGKGATYAKESIFIGTYAGKSDTVNNTNGVILTVNPIPDTAGSGYVVNDLLVIAGGSGNARVEVTSVDGGGGVTGVQKIVSGDYGYTVSSFNSTSGGSGTGCTIQITSVTTGTLNGTSIAIGRYSGTGGFSDSIAIGHGVINSAANEMNFGNVMKLTGIYASDTPSSAFLAGGKVGIGIVPTARLTLPAGTVDANTAPLKFTSGINTTVEVAGQMEYNGTNLFFTPIATRKTIAFAEDLDNTKIMTLTFVIDGGGSAITTGQKGHLEIPFACTINGWTLLADQSGSIVIDVWKDTYANYPPTVADTIAGTEKPTLSAVIKNQDLALTTWTTAVAAGDILAFNVDSVATVTRVTLSIKVTKT